MLFSCSLAACIAIGLSKQNQTVKVNIVWQNWKAYTAKFYIITTTCMAELGPLKASAFQHP